MERYKEFEANLAFSPCPGACQAWHEEGHKSINPKFTCKHTKVLPWGDPYCEFVIEFENE